jgi:hypothetical protein
VVKEVDATASEQGRFRQSLAGIVVGEKNRCVRISVPDAAGTPFSGAS